MSKFCKPMGLYVTYLDCLECEEKECRKLKQTNVNMEEQGQKKTALFVQNMENVNIQKRKEKEMKKIYLQVEPKQEVFLVFSSKRENYKNDIVIKCKVTKATVYTNETIYSCEPIKIVTKTKEDLKKYVSSLLFANANIDTGLRSGFNRYPVFTTKEKCLEWLKNR